MDKSIVEKLVKYGLITNIDVDANKYKDIDDLIAKGIITVPGAKTKILEIVGDFITELEETIETTKSLRSAQLSAVTGVPSANFITSGNLLASSCSLIKFILSNPF